jgi:hypothetical protein
MLYYNRYSLLSRNTNDLQTIVSYYYTFMVWLLLLLTLLFFFMLLSPASDFIVFCSSVLLRI